VRIEIREVERVELILDAETFYGKGGESRFSGYLAVGDDLRPLPVGSSLDRSGGVLTWHPGPGFIGTYRFVFLKRSAGELTRRTVEVLIKPKG
jgi:hypothetical protein